MERILPGPSGDQLFPGAQRQQNDTADVGLGIVGYGVGEAPPTTQRPACMGATRAVGA